MDNNILTLEQIQKMSIDEMIDAYRSGYALSGSTDAIPSYPHPIYSNSTDSTYTYSTHPIYSNSTNPITYPNLAYSYSTDITTSYPQTSPYRTLQADSHYTLSDIGVIAAAIVISVGLLAIIIRYMIRKEEERIVKEIKQTVESVTQKAGIVERLIPIAERIGERILAPKPSQPPTG